MNERLVQFKSSAWLSAGLLAAVSFAVMMPVLLNGLPMGHDLPHHYQCAMTFYEAFMRGDFYPVWSDARNLGYGGMEARLYPPVSHYALALFYAAFRDWHLASWACFTFFTFLGGYGAYLWAKETMPSRPAVFAGCLYLLLPYHLNQLYNTFFYAEYVASAVLPYTFVFVSRVCRRGSLADTAGLAASFAALILTHLPLTVIGSLCFTVYALFLLERGRLTGQLARLGGAVAAALAASSFFWTKVLLEKDLMAKASVYADPWLDYRLNFLLTAIQTYEGFALEVYENSTRFYDMMLLYAVVLVAGCTVPFYVKGQSLAVKEKAVWAVFALALFFSLPLSRPIWDRVALLQEVQFPWRFLAIVTLAAPVLAASRIDLLPVWLKNRMRPVGLIVAGCILACVTFSVSQIVRPATFIEKARIESFMAANARDEGLNFWWPKSARKEIFATKEQVRAGARAAAIETWSARTKEFRLAAGGETSARVAVFYHPHWQATADGQVLPVAPDEHGAATIHRLPAGPVRVRLEFVEPRFVRAAKPVSAAAWLGLLLLFLLPARGKKAGADFAPGATEEIDEREGGRAA